MASASSSEPAPKPEVAGESSEAVIANDQLLLHRGLKKAKKERGCTAKERISKMPPCTAGKRSSIYRGVTRHRWTGRYEAHLWDKTTWNQNQNKKGKQVYLGAYDDEEAAARAYDLAALKYWGPGTLINFPVTDYTRDLDEMQNVSREEYLASLRRKSSGFSRGISKYRGLSSRWDASFGRVAGSEYFSSMNYNSDDPAAESEYVGSFGVERKIDLTSYIKWWGSSKSRQLESIPRSSEEIKHGIPEDIGSELKTMEWAIHHTEPYQMPRLGISLEAKRQQGSTVSCLSILSRSAAYKSLEEKASKRQGSSNENDENENKNVNKLEYGKGVDKPASHGGNTEKLGAPLGVSGLCLQRNLYPFTSFLSTPHITNYNAIDPLDPILWTSLVPVLPSGLSRNSEVTKTEASSTYTYFRPEEE